MFLFRNFALKPLQIGEIVSNNKIMQFSYFYWDTNEKKPTRKRSYFTMEFAMTAILRDVSGKMHHGILFDRRLAKEQKRDEYGASFQSSPKINRMLITRLICIQSMKRYNTRSVCLLIEIFLVEILLFFSTIEIFTCSQVIDSFKR